MVTVYLININTEINSFQWTDFLNRISEERKERISKYKFEKDKKRCLFAEILLRFGLNTQFGISDDKIRFSYNQYGKPYLKDNDLIHFNISHSSEWIICVLADIEIGIDIEKVGKIPLGVSKRILTNKEYYLLSREKVNQQDMFYRYWTLKEAYTKARGYGMMLSFTDIQFNDIYKNINVLYKNEIDKKYLFNSQYIDNSHLVSICIEKDKDNNGNVFYKFIDSL